MTDDVEPVTVEFSSDSPTTIAPSTRLTLNGQDVTRFTHGFTLTAEVGNVTRVLVELYARTGFALKLPASVTLQITVFPGYRLVERTTFEGKEWETIPTDEGMA